MTPIVGLPLDRTDGPLKVAGTARYAADFPQAGMAYAVMVQSTVPNGSIRSTSIQPPRPSAPPACCT